MIIVLLLILLLVVRECTDNFGRGFEWTNTWVEKGTFFMETQDGKWYIEMKEVIK